MIMNKDINENNLSLLKCIKEQKKKNHEKWKELNTERKAIVAQEKEVKAMQIRKEKN